VAREVHDDALQRVALIRHEVEALSRSDTDPADPEGRQHLEAIAEEVADLGVTLRSVAHELHPSLIADVGLARALDALVADYHRTDGMTVHLTVPEEPVDLAPAGALALYRITQEALRNVIRHAGVLEANVALTLRDGLAVLTISDRGAGFQVGAARERPSLGLTSMKERAGMAGGRVSVTSSPGQGTTIEVTVPRLRPA